MDVGSAFSGPITDRRFDHDYSYDVTSDSDDYSYDSDSDDEDYYYYD